MERVNLIKYKDQNIFLMDFSDLKSENEIQDIINKSILFIRSQPKGSLLTLTDISNMHFNNNIKDLFTSFVKGNKPYVKAGSVVGISGLQSFVYNAIMKLTGRNIKSMKSIIEAKEWLVMNQ
jgi:hypothetical protein